MGVALPASFVVDCSIVGAAFLPDEQSPLGAAVREQCAELALVAPRVLRIEFLNLALVARRRGRLDDVHFADMLAQAARFPVQYDEGDTALAELGRGALQLGLTSYDYAYLDCAKRRGLPLATLDRALLRACARAGVETLTDSAGVAQARPRYPKPAARPRVARASRRGASANLTHI